MLSRHGSVPCPDCHQTVRRTITEKGRIQLVDPEPNDQGNTVARLDGTGTWRSRVPTEEWPAAPWEKPVMPHAATCRVRTGRERRAPHSSSLPPGVVSLADRRRTLPASRDEKDSV